MNPVNNRHYEQWARCDRSGVLLPMSKLRKQKGMLVSKEYFDDPTVEQRDSVIQAILQDQENEGVDHRHVDRGFFEDLEEEVY